MLAHILDHSYNESVTFQSLDYLDIIAVIDVVIVVTQL